MRHLLLVLTIMLLPGPFQGSAPGQGGNTPGASPGGILISPQGLIAQALATPVVPSMPGKQLREKAIAALPEALRQPAEIRMLSLRTLDARLTELATAGLPVPPELTWLAGLTRIDSITLSQDGTDLILSGPAEPFAALRSNRMTGLISGRPVLCLEDLLTAFRDDDVLDAAGCSIDPDSQRLAAAQGWLARNSSPAVVAVAKARLEQMVRLQGRWNVTTFGVPADSRMCLAMVEADYLMKRIAIGADSTGIRGMKSSLALARPGDNMMRRWWFASAPATLSVNPERTQWSLQGPRLLLLAQEEIMDNNGNLLDITTNRGSGDEFAQLFNQHLPELVQKVPAFADLQNILDILTAVAVCRELQEAGLLNLRPQMLTDSSILPGRSWPVPRETVPLLTTRSASGGLLMGAFTGGVNFRSRQLVRQALSADSVSPSTRPQINSLSPATLWQDTPAVQSQRASD
ncbi:MAG TPA: hypothetical protein DIT89_17025 [Planctomycetaceae bacterium]|nr:hypothetical protein [Planctomycetaceae bacterium]